MAGKAFENLNKIFLSDTFRAWFDKTNQIISTMNPLEIYGVTADKGELAGITFEIDNNGIVKFGLKLPNAVTGDLVFNGGITFNNYVSFAGKTFDLDPNKTGIGATAEGRIVRTINGQTGDITLTHVNVPGNVIDGDILYYEVSGTTFHGYNLFSDGTAENGMIHVGGSGGLFLGVTAGGESAANSFVKQGNIQLVGVGGTGSGIYFTDNTQSSLSTAKIAGADVRYATDGGSQVFTIAGKNISGQKHNSDNLIIDFNKQTISVAGAGTGPASINIGDKSENGRPVTYTDTNGATFSVKYLVAGETGAGRTSGGFTGASAFGGHPATKSLQDDQRVRLEYTAGSVEVEITGSGKTSGFAVMGKEQAGGPFGDLLLPTMVARRDGNVVIGGIAPSDGGITASTFGGLNIASGKLLVGGSAGKTITSGYQVLHSSGSTASWKLLESTAFSYSGTIGTPVHATITEDTNNGTDINITPFQQTSQAITFRDSNLQKMTGPYSGTVTFPLVRMHGNMSSVTKACIGIRIVEDGVVRDDFLRWEDYFGTAIGIYGTSLDHRISPTFTFNGNAETELKIIPFMTTGSPQLPAQSFSFINRGTYLVDFNKLG